MNTRRKIIQIIGYALLLGLLALFGFTLLFYQDLKIELHTEIQAYGSIAILITAFLADIIIGPIGPEVPIVGGLLAGVKLPTVLYMTAIGSTVASLVTFFIGRAFGEYGAMHFISAEKYKKWRRIFIRHRRLTMSLGALTPVPYVAITLISGIFKVRLWEFTLFAIGARMIRIIGVAYIVLLFQGAI